MKPRGAVIEDARVERGWSRRQLADLVGISYQHIYNVERGFKGASEKTLVPIARALGLTLDQAADRNADKEPGQERRANPTKAPEPSRPIPPPNPSKTPAKTEVGAA